MVEDLTGRGYRQSIRFALLGDLDFGSTPWKKRLWKTISDRPLVSNVSGVHPFKYWANSITTPEGSRTSAQEDA
jgi:hypothetical protein